MTAMEELIEFINVEFYADQRIWNKLDELENQLLTKEAQQREELYEQGQVDLINEIKDKVAHLLDRDNNSGIDLAADLINLLKNLKPKQR